MSLSAPKHEYAVRMAPFRHACPAGWRCRAPCPTSSQPKLGNEDRMSSSAAGGNGRPFRGGPLIHILFFITPLFTAASPRLAPFLLPRRRRCSDDCGAPPRSSLAPPSQAECRFDRSSCRRGLRGLERDLGGLTLKPLCRNARFCSQPRSWCLLRRRRFPPSMPIKFAARRRLLSRRRCRAAHPALAGGGASLWCSVLHHGRRDCGFRLGHVASLADLRRRSLAPLSPHVRGAAPPAARPRPRLDDAGPSHARNRTLAPRAFSFSSAWQFHSNSKDFRWRATILQCNNAGGVGLQSS
jgi:hypothetical protein